MIQISDQNVHCSLTHVEGVREVEINHKTSIRRCTIPKLLQSLVHPWRKVVPGVWAFGMTPTYHAH